MKLTKKQTAELLSILNGLEAVMSYLEREDVCIMNVREKVGYEAPGFWYSKLHSDKEMSGPYEKFVGSNLAMLPTEIRSLRDFIKKYQFHNHPLIL